MGSSGRRPPLRREYLEVGGGALDQYGKPSDWRAAIVAIAGEGHPPVYAEAAGASYIVGQDPRVDGALPRSA